MLVTSKTSWFDYPFIFLIPTILMLTRGGIDKELELVFASCLHNGFRKCINRFQYPWFFIHLWEWDQSSQMLITKQKPSTYMNWLDKTWTPTRANRIYCLLLTHKYVFQHCFISYDSIISRLWVMIQTRTTKIDNW